MRRLATIIFVLTLSVPAWADDTRRLTFEQVGALVPALTALDGRLKVVKDGAQERIVPEPYDIASGMRLLLAMQLVKAKASLVPLQSAFQTIQKQFANADGKVPDERLVEFNVAVRKLQDSLAEGEFATLRYEELKPQTNNFPPSVLAGLMPLLVIEDKK